MTTEAPDPRTFKTWEDAFQYPVPVVRKLEQQLRHNADENREKLRSLVGTSYRSLLNTAETIIDMEVRMHEVESKLARVGQSCNSRGLDKIANNAVKMEANMRSHDVARYTFAAQLSILRSAPTVMARLMKQNASYLLLAKVLVISRLLHKALTPNKPPIVDQMWEKLLSMRRKLLRRIDKRLATSGHAGLVESMCAYALATSSAPSDVLQHFHKVRMDAIMGELKRGEDLARHATTALKLCIQTCLDTQTIFPRRLADALAKLKAHPLVQDADVRQLSELHLDVHDRWIGDEARSYTPWPRHDELQRPDAERILTRWSKDAIAGFLKGIKKALDSEDGLRQVAHLRQELMETWILSGSRMAGVKSANVLDDLRDTMNEKLEAVVRARTRRLQSVAKDFAAVVEGLGAEASLPLWHTAEQSLNHGAEKFKGAILDTYQGRDQHVHSLTEAFDNWVGSVLEVKGIVKSMKEARWDDTFADDLDGDLDSKQTLLSDDDPRLLEHVTQEALGEALQDFGSSFASLVQKIQTGDIHRAVLVMRVAREFSERIPRLTALPSPFKADSLQDLRTVLATSVASPTIEAYKHSLSNALSRKSNNHILWEGSPPVPGQPSPSTFRFLRELNKHMAALGSDLWAPDCAAVLKKRVADGARLVLDEHVAAIKKDGGVQQRLKQVLFDALYLQRFVATPDGEDALAAFAQTVHVTGLDEAVRLKKNAADYAKKTYLLFALLACE
ncbi:para-aminobenzoate synthase, (PABA) [Pleosporales sp. CAS-2024a]